MAKKVTHLSDLVADPKNARRHNARNIGVIADSLAKVGAGRSIVIDEDNVVLCGNGVVEAAGERGIEKVQVVEADGNTIIAVRRSGLTKKQKAEMAISDNRAGDLSAFDDAALLKLIDETGAEAIGFTEEEMANLLGSNIVPAEGEWPSYDETESHQIVVRYRDDDIEAIRAFLGDEEIDLTDGKAGKKLLERIKEQSQT